MANKEIREEIERRRLRYYEVANRIGISQYTFSHWMQNKLTPEQEERTRKAIEKLSEEMKW
jgi:transcriptional regulator with XRE-family HTH domain